MPRQRRWPWTGLGRWDRGGSMPRLAITTSTKSDDTINEIDDVTDQTQRDVARAWPCLLPADLLGTLATFLDPTSAGAFAVTVGPHLSSIIKRAYFRRNFRLLGKKWTNPRVFRAFLDANEDWRHLYDNLYDDELVELSPLEKSIFESIFLDTTTLLSGGYVEVLKHLIEIRGRDVNESDQEGNSLLYRALSFGSVPALKYIVSVPGLDVNSAKDSADEGVLHTAMSIGSSERVAVLLSHRDIDVNIRGGEGGVTPLHRAVASKFDKGRFLHLLRHKDIDVDAVDNSGWTPLHLAMCGWFHSAQDDEDMGKKIKLLIEAGADPHFRNHHDVTPLDFAEIRGNDEHLTLVMGWIRKEQGVQCKGG